MLEDAGEFLHYGLGAASGFGCLIAVSQSGRSAETVRAVERVRGSLPIVAVVNDVASPVAAAADVVLDVDAGVEAAVATRTYVASVAVLALLAGRVVPDGPTPADVARAADEMDLQLHATDGARGARHLAGSRALVVVGRGPGLGAADYAALTIKESAAIPAESLSGGAFRHGPLELSRPPTSGSSCSRRWAPPRRSRPGSPARSRPTGVGPGSSRTRRSRTGRTTRPRSCARSCPTCRSRSPSSRAPSPCSRRRTSWREPRVGARASPSWRRR